MNVPGSQSQERQALERRAEQLDQELVQLLESRAEVARRLRALTEGESGHEVDEAAWLQTLERRGTGQVPPESLRSILREVRAALRGIEAPGRIAYVGPEQGICHQLIRRHFGAGSFTLECASVEEALDAVSRGRAATAAIPLESSNDGLAQSSVTALAASNLVIVGERSVPVAFDLVSRTRFDGRLDDVRRVYLTPAAYTACRNFLGQRLSGADIIEASSPLESIDKAASDASSAAIVLEDCARDSDLTVIERNVGDTHDAFIRYAFVSSRPAKRSEWNRTCLLFGVQDEPGSLFEVLRHFAERGLNLGRVQSRPLPRTALLRGKGWDYAFYVEVDGHETDRAMVAALDRVRRSTKYLRVLGSYPLDEPAD